MKKTAIIMCSWKRFNRFREIVKELNAQTDKNYSLFVWNNNGNDLNANTKLEYCQSIAIGYDMYVHNNKENIRGFARFVMANLLLNNKLNGVVATDYDKIIFIDDDVKIRPDFVEYMVSQYEPETYKGRHAYRVYGNYWERELVGKDMECDYVGTGGAVIDPAIFSTDKFFKTYLYNQEAYWLEDYQLSVYCKSIGWKVKGCGDEGHYKPLPPDQHEQWTATYTINGKNYSARDLKIIGGNLIKKHYGQI